ncbi:MAG: T9SS type A sorting domain-containing protein [Ignavibacteria bacterium]|nr:T9SS type A sorting domain-containing protein [Ignavibacteria bacterium]
MKNLTTKLFLVLTLLFFSNLSLAQTGWIQQNSGTNQDIRSLCFINSQTGWVVGFGGIIKKTTDGGNYWTSQYSGTSHGLITVLFIDNNTGWAAGGNQTDHITFICKTTNGGQNWFTQFFSTSVGIVFRLFFLNSNTGWAACGIGNVLKTTDGGQSWSITYVNNYVDLVHCVFVNQNTGWTIGEDGIIKKTTNGGSIWVTQPCNTTQNLQGLFMFNANTGFITSCVGELFKTTNSGLNWISIPTGSSQWLNSIYFIDNNTGWIVGGAYNGGNSQILKTIDGGNNWTFQNSPTSVWLGDVTFIDPNTGWAVGRSGVIIKTTNGGASTPLPPVLTSPPNNSVNISVTPTLTWNTSQGAETYHVQISTVANFYVITDSATVSSPQYQVPTGKLMNGYTYFWRVNASNPAGTSGWSSTWSFSTGIYPPAPVLISPPNGFIGTPTTPTLVWDSLQNIISYRIEISRIPNFLNIVDSSTVFINQYIVPPGILFDNITYFWRVNASNSFGSGPWSEVWSFTPQPTGINPIAGEIPTSFNLFQNYPNPFNPSTNIKFDIPKSSYVKIIVYNNLGKEVAKLVDKKLSAGSYEVNWNTMNYASGIYYYRIGAEEFTNVKKMLLIK